jgi:hypothetical protein
VDVNAKTAKELRRAARDSLKPGSRVSKLLAKPVRLSDGTTAVVAIQSHNSVRGRYRALKAAVEKNPELLEQLKGVAAYRRMLEHEKKSGGPLFGEPQPKEEGT